MPCVYQRRLWYVIPVTPRSRAIFADTNAEIVVDPSIPCTDHEIEMEGVEVDEIVTVPTTSYSTEEDVDEDADDGDDDLATASDEDSINLFIDLGTMDLDMDPSACRDLLADEN